MSRLRASKSRPLEAPRRSFYGFQLSQALDRPGPATREGQIPWHVHCRCPRRLRCLRENALARCKIWSPMASQRALVSCARHGSRNGELRIWLHHLNILRTAIPLSPSIEHRRPSHWRPVSLPSPCQHITAHQITK